MRKLATGLVMVAATIAAAACKDALQVTNPNNPNIAQVLATGTDIEAVFAQGYLQVGFTGSGIHTNNIAPQLNAMSLESYGNVANFDMVYRAAIPRKFIDNSVNNSGAGVHFADFQNMQKLARGISIAIAALDKFTAGGKSLGSASQDARARAWGFFELGLALGNSALVYDSASIVTPTTPTLGPPQPLSGYAAVMTAALGDLDSALTIARSTAVTGNPTPFTSTWINGLSVDQPTFIRIVRSYQARFRAGVARTPADRAAVNWDQVIADATNGITSDLVVTLSIQAGWQQQEVTNCYRYGGWGDASMLYLGMADTSGAYDAWLTTSMINRQPFLLRTGDNRWPSGEDRNSQIISSGGTLTGQDVAVPGTTGLYLRNRQPGQDPPGDPWGTSFYDHYRFRYLTVNNSDNKGPWIEMSLSEINLLAAEGYIRKGNFAAAAPLIDVSRTQHNLPPLTGTVADGTSPVPGATYVGGKMTAVVPGAQNCVPRVPSGPNGPTACGNMMEALKYEYRMETYFTGYGQWFFAERGWGDLVEGTPLQFPVPYQEMQVRLKPFYNLGGVGNPSAAAKGTYGF
ncbi:MAG TPA: hypothetical protein VH080_00760 [Gemmatimonadaceae bacterium]|nr:hypothetical protein [Gemmatimonadaceae bacterium]